MYSDCVLITTELSKSIMTHTRTWVPSQENGPENLVGLNAGLLFVSLRDQQAIPFVQPAIKRPKNTQLLVYLNMARCPSN